MDLARQATGPCRAESGTQPGKRGALWAKVQQVVYDEVPYINVGKFASLSARSPALQAYTPHTYPFFWNTSLKG